VNNYFGVFECRGCPKFRNSTAARGIRNPDSAAQEQIAGDEKLQGYLGDLQALEEEKLSMQAQLGIMRIKLRSLRSS